MEAELLRYGGVRALPAGTVVGRYKLVKLIGEGGMGSVYLVEQVQPVKRRVALKIAKPGIDSVQVLARFEAERQVLASLNHPNVARVLDAGTTEHGLPYFVMELVLGEPITAYCDADALPVEDRLRLFADVCAAIHHSHQHGILHRDIKPSNVLVTEVDGRPVPKVIDFGIAKAFGDTTIGHSLATQTGAIFGTLEYMSPEQAEGNSSAVDTRSDVYALGVM
jgi:serine/threonine protein kinase